ncbi:MAG: hypothetical protein R3Y19_03255 [Rikenellaceae bacterium]
MKNLGIILVCICSILTTSAQKPLNFSISGKIEGAQKGDTLRFMTVSSDWKQQTPVFDVVVGRSGKVKYKGSHLYSQNYVYFFHPKDTSYKVHSSRYSSSLFLTDAEVRIEADREYIYHPTLTGGVYDKELQLIKEKENSVGKERDSIYQCLKSAERCADTAQIRKFVEEFNSFLSQKEIKERRAEIENLTQEYLHNYSNEYVVYELLTSYSYMTLDSLENYYDKQIESVKDSYYGVALHNKITLLKALEPQMPAPEFTLTTITDEVVTNKDLLGKYVLIYHYGMCPGSLSLDKKLSDWYVEHKDKAEVIGYTSTRESIVKMAEGIKSGDKLMGFDLYEALQSMVNHPWKYEVDAGRNDANGALEKIYDFRGLPFFILISPEGKILDRSFTTFYSGSLDVVDAPVQ